MNGEEEEMEGRRRNHSSLRCFFLFLFCLLGQDFPSEQGPFCMFLNGPFCIFVDASEVTSRQLLSSSSSSLSLAARKNVRLKISKTNSSSTFCAVPSFSSYSFLSSVSRPLRLICETRRRHSPPSSFLSSPLDLFSSSSFFHFPCSSSSSSLPSCVSSLVFHRHVSSSPSFFVVRPSSTPENRSFLASSSFFSHAVSSVSTPFTSSPSALPFRSTSSITRRDLPTQTNAFIRSFSLPSLPSRDTSRSPLSSLDLSLNPNLIGQSQKAEDPDGRENAEPDVVQQRVKDFVSSAPIVLFMKGTPDFPQCGFSRAIVQLLELAAKDVKVPETIETTTGPSLPSLGDSSFFLLSKRFPGNFSRYLNVLDDFDMREGVKRYTSWPTIPQLFINQTFLGGLDVATEMFKDRSLHRAMDEAIQEYYARQQQGNAETFS
ncbi:glutaredoxin domain-containing protein [Cystoisospora suis]|uniref:Glutaredoxin domain-containing protein n=1 Tax=Cystoisospora suis TaxID=483139 RepID=A0A2C6L2L2_9APIC|nr:glutaredoxin domain-containing protein [Cystoisospora suis]